MKDAVGGERRRSGRRIAAWVAAIALVLGVPWVATQFTAEVAWDAADFVFAGTLVAAVAVAYELAAGKSASAAYRAGVGVALAAVFMLVWINAAVGIIGSENNRANLMFAGVLAVGLLGAAVARLRPAGMARALMATALAQAVVAVIALVGGLGATGANWPADVLALSGCFAAMWIASAWLFRKAARERIGDR